MVGEGDAPIVELPPGCARELSKAERPLQTLLLSTHSEEAGAPPGLGVLDARSAADERRTMLTATYIASVAMRRLRTELAVGDDESAMTTCVDLLALARDLSWGTGLTGRLAALTVSQVAFEPCAAALDAAPASTKRRAALTLGRVARGTPPLAATLADTSVALRAQVFAPYLVEDMPGLPPAVQEWASAGAPREDFPGWVRRIWQWNDLQEFLDAASAAAALPPAEAQRRLSTLTAKQRSSRGPLGQLALPELGGVAMNDDVARRQLLLLRRAALVGALRTETGIWPRAGDLPFGLESNAEHPFSIEDKGSEAILVDASGPGKELKVRLHADL